jgi:hypothetical protein
MQDLTTMIWDETLWGALCASITLIPPIVRKRAFLRIIQASESNAKSRSAEKVETGDLVKAVNENVPETVRKLCFETLAEHGINLSL